MGNNAQRQRSGAVNSSFRGRQSSFQRLRSWASRISLRTPSSEELIETEIDGRKNFMRKWNRKSRKHVRTSTIADPYGSSKTKWPVPFIESLFLPEFPVKGGPSEVDDYEVIDVIASGSFGNVLKVRGEDDKAIYALKVIDKGRVFQQGQGVVEQCKEEVGIQGALSHSKFVAKLITHWQTRKRLYLLIEFISKGELFAMWKLHGSFSESLARFYVAQLACSLDFLHRTGIVYRDLKMENILLNYDGHLVLVDFGLAKWLRRGQTTLTICGTLAYSAPEMLNSQPYDHSIDWWSLGVLFYALLVGRFPLYGAKHHKQMGQWVRLHDYDAPSFLSWEARYTMEQLLQKNPRKRLMHLAMVAQSPFFKGNIDFDMVERHSYDPRSFFTQEDMARGPQDNGEQAYQMVQQRGVFPDPDDNELGSFTSDVSSD